MQPDASIVAASRRPILPDANQHELASRHQTIIRFGDQIMSP